MKSMLKDAAVLLVITIFAGLILGGVYQITKEPIAQAEEAAAQEAYRQVFSDAEAFRTPAEETGTMDEAAWIDAGFEMVSVDQVLEAVDSSDTVLGYVLTVTSHEGYGGDITFTMGIRKDGTLNGISLLSISETAGLGMKAEEVLQPQFAGKKVSSFTYTKSGAASESQIDAISGATITTNAVTTAVNGGLYYFQVQLGGSSYEAE